MGFALGLRLFRVDALSDPKHGNTWKLTAKLHWGMQGIIGRFPFLDPFRGLGEF